MEFEACIRIIPEVIDDLQKEYVFNNKIIRDDIFGILEKHCIVVYYPLENERNCGFHTKRFVKDERRDFVYINTAKPLAEQVFTAAHELGHVWGVIDKIKGKISCECSFSIDEEEDLINRFAAELLMPNQLFRDSFFAHWKEVCVEEQKIKLDDLIRIVVMQMNDFMVPYESVRRRMIETEIISPKIGEVLVRNKESILILVNAYSKDLNTVLDNKTGKKTIPGLRNLIEQIECEAKMDEYTLLKIKKDFGIIDLKSTDKVIEIGIGENNNGED